MRTEQHTNSDVLKHIAVQHFDTLYFRYLVTFYPNPTTQTILYACSEKVLYFSDMCKQIYHNSTHCIRNRSIYVYLRQIFRQRRLICSLAKAFKLFTSVRLKSVKNSPSPKPTTSSSTFYGIRIIPSYPFQKHCFR